MLATTKVADLPSAYTAIREAAISNNLTAVDIYFDSIDNGKRNRLQIYGLCRDTYREQTTDFVRVKAHVNTASAHFEIDLARDWVEQVEDIVDWLATETPASAVPCD